MKTTTRGDLARFARFYTDRARPVAGQSPDAVPETEVDVRIDVELHASLQTVADFRDQAVTDVARAVLFTAASKVTAAQVRRFHEQRDIAAADASARAEKRARSRGLAEEEVQRLIQRARNRVLRQRLPLRRYHQNRYRLRFTVPTEAYTKARDAIQASGESVAVVVERGLYNYVESEGQIN